MKKYILVFMLFAAVLLCSGCNKSEENSELDELINGLPTIYLGGENGGPVEDKPSYKSITGTVTAISKKKITVKADDQEYKIAINNYPQIFGGVLERGLTVTVSFDSTQDMEKTITPTSITILDGDPDITVSQEEPVPTEAGNTEATADSSDESNQAEAEITDENTEPAADETEEEAEEETAEETNA